MSQKANTKAAVVVSERDQMAKAHNTMNTMQTYIIPAWRSLQMFIAMVIIPVTSMIE